MGTWGPGALNNDGALDLLDTLAEQDAAQRRQTLEWFVLERNDHEHKSYLATAIVIGCGERRRGRRSQVLLGSTRRHHP